MVRPAGFFAGTLLRYGDLYTAFEHARAGQSTANNTLIWIGGLGDGLLTVDYPITLSQRLPPNWTLMEATTGAALNGFGTSSLARDADQLSLLVSYVRKLRPESGKIVLMGHSTGCQDAMEYTTGSGANSRERLDGVILQAPASDREGLLLEVARRDYDNIVVVARRYVDEGRSNDVLPFNVTGPLYKDTPVSAYRALSLLSPNGDGDDDYFSSDLSDETLKQSFGNFPNTTSLMFLFSGEDEHVPKTIDVPALLQRWTGFVRNAGGVVDSDNGGIVPGASHNLNDNDIDVVHNLCDRVNAFLQKL